ncbi:hypothetical protein Vadar_005275 [Vaccinium darrowii]|uniref:Uncharacterized protein n=1 Tax=Vaccinium darrowii TaxID=229202 RepID=A0ACB7XNB7_9ERIC|nr:hypothetical protein Vadar_005275 [Vaccinium darrowii]
MAFILNLENPFQELELQTEILFQMETGYMAAPGFFQNGNINHRWGAQQVIRMLMETSGLVHDPFVPFLALNFYDRFISRFVILRPWFFSLFAICCTTLAWKTRRNDFSVQELLAASQPRITYVGGLETVVQARHIEEMEFAILSVLNWRTRPITPVCFMNFFMSLLGIDDPQQRQALKEQVFEHQILYMHRDIRFTRFRPSIIAVVGIMAEREEDRQDDFWNPVRVCDFVNLEEMENCLNLLEMARAEEIAAAAVVPQNAPPPPAPQNAAAAVVPQNAPPPQVPQNAAAAVVPQNAEPPQVPQNDDPLQPRTPPQQE